MCNVGNMPNLKNKRRHLFGSQSTYCLHYRHTNNIRVHCSLMYFWCLCLSNMAAFTGALVQKKFWRLLLLLSRWLNNWPYALAVVLSTMWTEKTQQNVLSYLPQNPVDSDIVWYTLPWINLRYTSLNVFQLTWIVSYTTLWNLAFMFCKWTATGTASANPKTHQMFSSCRLQNQADSDKILYLLSWIYLPKNSTNVFHLT